jgi:hypothetical protein
VDARFIARHVQRRSLLRDGIDDRFAQIGGASDARMGDSFILTRPAPRRHQHGNLDQRWCKSGIETQVFAKRLQLVGEFRIVQ